jgi:hypothetical protein
MVGVEAWSKEVVCSNSWSQSVTAGTLGILRLVFDKSTYAADHMRFFYGFYLMEI